MRKIDRLFEIVQLLRGQRLRTAGFIAGKLGVSVRTIYRDIQGLMASGIPIEGERGVGYLIVQPIELPPLHFSPLELKAIMMGIDLVSAVADNEVAGAAQEASIKIRDTLPAHKKGNQHIPIAHIYFESDAHTRNTLQGFRHALDSKHKVSIIYKNQARQKTKRTIRPLGLEYWGKVWTLTAWCELRNDFRVFRIDRISSSNVLDEIFKAEKGKTYQDYLKRLENEH